MAKTQLELEITAEIGDLKRDLNKVQHELKGLGGSAKGAQGSTGGLLGQLQGFKGAAVAGGIAAVATGVAMLGKRGLETAAALEQQEVAFGTLLGSMEKGKALMRDVQQFAASTPFQLPELNDSTKKLLAFGVAEDEVISKLQSIGDISAGVGAPINEIAEIFGKAKVQGTLFAEDINQLVGRGIPVIQEFAKQMGVSEGEVKKLASQGKITFPMLEKAFVDLTAEGGKFAGMMDAQSKTLNGVMSTLQDNFDMLLAETMKPLLPVITDLMGTLIEIMSDPAVKEFVEMIGKQLAFHLKMIAWQIKAAIKAWKDFVGGIESAVNWVKSLAGATEESGEKAEFAKEKYEDLGTAAEDAAKKAYNAMLDAVRKANPAVGELQAKIKELQKMQGFARTREQYDRWQKSIDRVKAQLAKLTGEEDKNSKKKKEAFKDRSITIDILHNERDAINEVREALTFLAASYVGTVRTMGQMVEEADLSDAFVGEDGVLKNLDLSTSMLDDFALAWEQVGLTIADVGAIFRTAFAGGEDPLKGMLKTLLNVGIDFLEAEIAIAAGYATIKALLSSGVSAITDAPLAVAAYAALEAARGYVNSFERGSMYIPYDMPALLHGGERVLTREQNEQYERTGRIAGQGGRSNRMGKTEVVFVRGAFAGEVGAFGNAKARQTA